MAHMTRRRPLPPPRVRISFLLPLYLNRLAVALCVLILGITLSS